MPAERRRKAAAVVLAITALAGCGSGDQADVRQAAKDFFAKASADGPEACKLASKRYAASPDGCLNDAKAFGEDSDKIEPVSAVNEIEIDGDNATARIVSQGRAAARRDASGEGGRRVALRRDRPVSSVTRRR